MDVLHVASGGIWAGAEAQVALLAVAQREQGQRVRAATFAHGELASRLARQGIETKVLDERKGAISVWRSLRQWISTDPPLVLHAHGYKEAILGFSATINHRVARVRTQHGVPELPLGVGGAQMRMYDLIDHSFGRILRAHWIAVSAPIESDLRRSFGDRVHRVTNSVSAQPTGRPAEQLQLELNLGKVDHPVLFYAGRLEPVKGPDILVEAFARVLDVFPRAVLLIAGRGSSEHFVRARIDELHISDRVRMIGERRDVIDLMMLADLFVLPSRGEGMPTVLLEALACGCPVVATRVGAVEEVTRGIALATLVPPEQAAVLADACVRSLAGSTPRAEMAHVGDGNIRARFRPARAADETSIVYAAALEETNGRQPGIVRRT